MSEPELVEKDWVGSWVDGRSNCGGSSGGSGSSTRRLYGRVTKHCVYGTVVDGGRRWWDIGGIVRRWIDGNSQ